MAGILVVLEAPRIRSMWDKGLLMNNNQLAVVLAFCMVLMFASYAYVEGTNTRRIIETCREAK